MIWIGIFAVALATLAAVLWPLLKAPKPALARVDYDLTIFRDQLKEVDRDVERGVLTAEEAEAARLEIQRRMLAADKAAPKAAAVDAPKRRFALAGAIGVLVPVMALGIYLKVGAPTYVPAPAVAENGETNEADMAKMIDQLAARVAANPGDSIGAGLLARSYASMGRFGDAVEVYRKLLALTPNAENYASYAELMIAGASGQVSKEAHDALVKALTYDRTEARARFYLGFEAAAKGDQKTAIAIWRDLTAAAPADAPWLDMVKQQMAAAAQEAGIPPMTVEPKHPLDLLPPAEVAAAKAAGPPAAAAPSTQANAAPSRNVTANPSPVAPQGSGTGSVNDMPPEARERVSMMVAGLASRLASNPEDYDGWLLLGRSYTVLKDFDGAKGAYEKAIALKPKEVEPRLHMMASLMTMVDANDQKPLPKPVTDAAADILTLDPKQPDALFVSGIARLRAGDTSGAKVLWTRARDVMTPGSPQRNAVEQRLKALP